MPCYPALALLLGSAMAAGGSWIRWGTRVLAIISAVCGHRRDRHPDLRSPRAHSRRHFCSSQQPSDRLQALARPHGRSHPEFICLSPFSSGPGRGCLPYRRRGDAAREQPTRLSCRCCDDGAVFSGSPPGDGHLRPLSFLAALGASDSEIGRQARIIVDSQYYIYSSIAYYTDRPELLLNGRWNNLEYGSYAPGAPNVFINDAEFKRSVAPAGSLLPCNQNSAVPRWTVWWASKSSFGHGREASWSIRITHWHSLGFGVATSGLNTQAAMMAGPVARHCNLMRISNVLRLYP